ncbi:MAG: group III truncated hemoglobin [Pyrinomonadaceae bacterium]
MKKEIETREDLEKLLTEFYRIAPFDQQIGHHFDDTDLDAHLPIIVDFWEKVLFGKPVYFSNPLLVHQILNAKAALTLSDFQRWVEIFTNTVDKFFTGEIADTAKLRARAIADSLHKNLNPVNLKRAIKTP